MSKLARSSHSQLGHTAGSCEAIFLGPQFLTLVEQDDVQVQF